MSYDISNASSQWEKKKRPPKPHQRELVGGDKIPELDT